jgi:hypothetical protein
MKVGHIGILEVLGFIEKYLFLLKVVIRKVLIG